jgi:hypothetical protein
MAERALKCRACVEPDDRDQSPCVLIADDNWQHPELCPFVEGRFAEWKEA